MKQKLLTLFLTLTLTVTSAFPGVALAAAGDEISASAAIEASAAPKTMSASEKWAHWKLHYMVRNRQAHWSAEWTALKMTFTAPLPLTLF